MALVYAEAAGTGVDRRVHENSVRVLIPQTLIQTRRILLKWTRDPTVIIEVLVLPVLFLLTLEIVLGHAVSQASGHSALYGTVPLNTLAAAINGSAVGAIGLINERDDGLLRRLWVVPVHRASGICSRIVAEMVRIMITTWVVLAAGMILGFRFHQGVLASLVWLAIPLIFGLALATLVTTVAWYAAKNFLLEAITLVHLLAILYSTGFLPVDQFPKMDTAGRCAPTAELRDRRDAWIIAGRSGAMAIDRDAAMGWRHRCGMHSSNAGGLSTSQYALKREYLECFPDP